MLTIKLSRRGKKKYPVYSLLILEKTKDPWGDYLERLGIYNPHTKKAELKAERIKYWLSKGAQCSPTVNNLLISQGIIQGRKVKAGGRRLGKKKREKLAATVKIDAKKEKIEIEKNSENKEEIKAEETKKETETEIITETKTVENKSE